MQGTAKHAKGIALPYLRAWRVYKLMGSAELANRAEVTQAAISKIENGHNASWSTIDKLARALGVSREDLARKDPGTFAA